MFNSLTWSRSDVVQVDLPYEASPDKTWAIVDHNGQIQPSQQLTADTQRPNESKRSACLAFLAKDIPGVGYGVFWLDQVPTSTVHHAAETDSGDLNSATFNSVPFNKEQWVLENELMRVVINPDSGNIESLLDKNQQCEVIVGAGNQLQFFRDEGQYWDAWNIAPDYESHRLPDPTLITIQWIDQGVVQQRLRIVMEFGRSRIQQDYVLQAQSPVLRVESSVDWHEDYTLLKACFPVNFEAKTATYEMPCGAIERSPTPTTPEERAKWEVPALNWADVSNGMSDESAYGVSILSDYKHGYDTTASHIRLTLLKSPKWPDPDADRGHHRFTYGIYPHTGQWTTAETTRKGYAFNQPLIGVPIQPSTQTEQTFPSIGQFLNIPQTNLFLTAFKQAETNTKQWMIRVYEGHGDSTKFTPEVVFPTMAASGLHLSCHGMSNLLEEELDKSTDDSDALSLKERRQNNPGTESNVAIAPWKITTLTFQVDELREQS
ncbi:MAG: glycoside hydrolase family 38 C-terminal domain-containing protein [Cyanobacteria bacterium P01_A01_bin.37]